MPRRVPTRVCWVQPLDLYAWMWRWLRKHRRHKGFLRTLTKQIVRIFKNDLVRRIPPPTIFRVHWRLRRFRLHQQLHGFIGRSNQILPLRREMSRWNHLNNYYSVLKYNIFQYWVIVIILHSVLKYMHHMFIGHTFIGTRSFIGHAFGHSEKPINVWF